MTAGFRLTQLASRQIRNIALYTAQTWGKAQGRRYVEGLRQRLGWLAASPELGRARDDVVSGLRGFPYERHIIFYRKSEMGIDVIAVLHQAQDATSLRDIRQ